jgi:hypothetical protein
METGRSPSAQPVDADQYAPDPRGAGQLSHREHPHHENTTDISLSHKKFQPLEF